MVPGHNRLLSVWHGSENTCHAVFCQAEHLLMVFVDTLHSSERTLHHPIASENRRVPDSSAFSFYGG